MWDVSLYEKKSSGLLVKSAKEMWVELTNMLFLALHCGAWKYHLFESKSDKLEDHKSLQDIFTKLVLSLCYPRWNEIYYGLENC